MRTMVHAAIAAFGIASISPAIAGEGEGPIANTQFAQLPGVIAQAPVQDVQHVAVAQDGRRDNTFVTVSRQGTWLFPPHDGGGDNQ